MFRDAVVGVPSMEMPDLLRVHPGRPDSSYLIMKLRGAEGIIGARMPLVGDPLSEEDMNAVESWIRSLTEDDMTAAGSRRSSGPVFAFDGWKAINLPTTRAVDGGSWLFAIQHRFNPRLSDGYDAFYGLDGSGIIHLGLGYAVTDRLLVALARSNAADDVELQGRYQIARERRSGGFPVDIGLTGSLNWITERLADERRLRGEAFKLSLQASFARAIGSRLGLAVVPGILFNPVESVSGEPPTTTVGVAGQWHLTRKLAVIGEWVAIVDGYTRSMTFGNDNRFDSGGVGLQITTGGHVFQIVLANAVGIASDQYLRGADLDFLGGQMRLGFNIYRVLNF
jgi:hypothetical protein